MVTDTVNQCVKRGHTTLEDTHVCDVLYADTDDIILLQLLLRVSSNQMLSGTRVSISLIKYDPGF